MMKLKKNALLTLLFGMFLLSSGCALIADYNPEAEERVNVLKTEINTTFNEISTAFGTEKANYSYFEQEYADINSKIADLIKQTQAIPLNQDTVGQLQALQKSIVQVILIHKQGFKTRDQVTLLQSSINSQISLIDFLENKKSRS